MTKSKQEWEVEAQQFMDMLSILDLAILNSIVYHKIQEERQRVVEMIEKLDVYTTWSMSDGRGEERLNKKEVLAIISDLQSKLIIKNKEDL